MPLAAHVTVAPVPAPVSSINGRAVLRAIPVALFQCDRVTTPAVSVAAIGVGLLPTKLMLMAPVPVVSEPAVTLTATVVVALAEPLVPVIVIEALVAAAPAGTATVIVDVPPPVTNAGANETVVPAG